MQNMDVNIKFSGGLELLFKNQKDYNVKLPDSTEKFRPDFNLMDDNVRPHKAHLFDEFLKSENIHLRDQPVAERAEERGERVPASLKNRWCPMAATNHQGKAGFKCSCYILPLHRRRPSQRGGVLADIMAFSPAVPRGRGSRVV
ncbi:hypothetical protein TNCV_1307811 [Trichonephila clavipes]|nr:hypothetical protein TNCV_1307811 [Trichonephila clavipes]